MPVWQISQKKIKGLKNEKDLVQAQSRSPLTVKQHYYLLKCCMQGNGIQNTLLMHNSQYFTVVISRRNV